MNAVLYIHGMGGNAGESAFYAPLFLGRDVIGLDYKTFTPRETGKEIKDAVVSLKKRYADVLVIANSIGAFFLMHSGTCGLISRAYFISPVVDMESMISGMMARAGVDEKELEQKGVIETGEGALSWEYLSYVRTHKPVWNTPTFILYGGGDETVAYGDVKRFAMTHNARLTVMEGGEHWFHTDEQMQFLRSWMIKNENGAKAMEASGIVIRSEKKEEQREVEELIRDSFWNVYRPGCLEHYVIHVLRGDKAFVPELDLVMEKDGRIIGQNMFMKTVIENDGGGVTDVLTMGPICIANDLKRKGYGKFLLDRSLELAAEMGFGAVLFEGNIKFYGNCGFDYARNFGIRYHDLPEGADSSFFLCRDLIPGYLKDVTGVYQTPEGYYVDEDAAEEFDKSFEPKEKLRLPGQLF